MYLSCRSPRLSQPHTVALLAKWHGIVRQDQATAPHGQIVRHADGLVHRRVRHRTDSPWRTWQLHHPIQDVLLRAAIDRTICRGYSFFHGIAAGAFLVRPFHHFHFLLRRAVRVRTRRFRQGGSEGVCPREIIRGKADTGNCENKEKPLKRGGALRVRNIAARCS